MTGGAPTIMGQASHELLRQLRLFLEEICCDLCRVLAMKHDGASNEDIETIREVDLGRPATFADMLVRRAGKTPYFLEVKYAYAEDKLVAHLAGKYGQPSPTVPDADRLVVVIDRADRADWDGLCARVRAAVRPELALELWDEARLREHIRDCFAFDLPEPSVAGLAELRNVIDDAKWLWTFGEAHVHSPLKSALLWHFGYPRLQRLHRLHGWTPEQILPPCRYRAAVVVLADLSGFSGYVRDTRDDEVVRSALTTFYSNARYAIVNGGGMMVQFVGDEVLALFGVPEAEEDCARPALACARSLLHIGASVSARWQRSLDRMQPARGVHVGIAMGDIQVVLYRPFSQAHLGVVGDAVNLAARLMAEAGPGELVVSNTFFQRLPEAGQTTFDELPPVEAKNVGMLKAWKLRRGE